MLAFGNHEHLILDKYFSTMTSDFLDINLEYFIYSIIMQFVKLTWMLNVTAVVMVMGTIAP